MAMNTARRESRGLGEYLRERCGVDARYDGMLERSQPGLGGRPCEGADW
jgi:hypothetical protein